MCEWGDTVEVRVLVSGRHSHSGKPEWRVKAIDRCIAPLVEALQKPGTYTDSSCCGHGTAPGSIVLQDGRVLMIVDYWEYDHEWVFAWRWLKHKLWRIFRR